MLLLLRAGNASPERVFSAVLRKLDRRKFEVVVFAQDTPQAPPGVAILDAADRVVFLPGHERLASISEPTRAGGGRTVSPGLPSLHRSREVIQAEQVEPCVTVVSLFVPFVIVRWDSASLQTVSQPPCSEESQECLARTAVICISSK